MSQAPKNPEMYELVTDWIIENPNRPLTSKGIAEAFGESKVSEAKPPKPGSGNNGPEM